MATSAVKAGTLRQAGVLATGDRSVRIPPVVKPWGENLTDGDYRSLAARWIPPELADLAGLRRVDSNAGVGTVQERAQERARVALPEGVPVMSRCPSLCPSLCPSWCPSIRAFPINGWPVVPVLLRTSAGSDVMQRPGELNIRKRLGHTGTLGHLDGVDLFGEGAAAA
jgi:hypothetical protein